MGGGWQTKFNVSPGPGLCSFVLGPSGPDLGPDLDLTWDLDLSLTIKFFNNLTITYKLLDKATEIKLMTEKDKRNAYFSKSTP